MTGISLHWALASDFSVVSPEFFSRGFFMVFHGFARFFRGFLRGFAGFLRFFAVFYVFSRFFAVFHGFSRFFTVFQPNLFQGDMMILCPSTISDNLLETDQGSIL
jgi:hypothetical protein